jgi:glycosyltransferase involved in cell wall biosynthesis
MKILFTCADKATISRNKFHIDTLKSKFDYSEVISNKGGYLKRIPSILARLPFKMIGKDAYFVGYMGHFLVPIMRLFTKKPIIYDFYLSLYDVMCNDRKLYSPNSLLGKFTYWLEKKSLKDASYIIVDTNELIKSLSNEYGIDRSKFTKVHLTINEDNVYPKEVKRYKNNFTVLYVGSYIPLHGTPTIIEAAKIVEELGEDVEFLMIGQGPQLQECQELASRYNLKNIEFKGFMPLEELNYYYNACDINLGLFNSGARAQSVVLNKTNDSFRVGKPHLTLKTPAMQEAFSDGVDILFVEDIKASTLAAKIVELKNNPELVKKVGQGALKSYEEKLSNKKAKDILQEAIFKRLENA